MDIAQVIKRIKEHKEAHRIGMIASHLGVVRGNSRNGKGVSAVDVVYDRDALNEIVQEIKSMEGIVEVLVEINEGKLNVGDELMIVAVGGDIRENVFPALTKAVDSIKARAARKKEFYTE